MNRFDELVEGYRTQGDKYPQHFVRFFKSHIGKTPSAYRNALI